MMRFQYWLLILAACVAATTAQSGTLEPLLSAEGQVQMHVENGQVKSCGVRVIVVAERNSKQEIMGIDTSVNVAYPGFGTVKGLVSQGTLDKYEKGELKRLKLHSIWFRNPSGLTTTPVNDKYLDSPETPKAIIYPTQLNSAIEIIDAVLEGKVIQLGIRLENQDYDRIYFGQVAMLEQEKLQLAQCLKDWSGSILEEHKAKSQKSKK